MSKQRFSRRAIFGHTHARTRICARCKQVIRKYERYTHTWDGPVHRECPKPQAPVIPLQQQVATPKQRANQLRGKDPDDIDNPKMHPWQ